MATTITSSSLDFLAIKNNLKTFLAAKDEFTDYDFEASGLSNILDVLAYNTHLKGLTANFALNEAFLGTAQLRSSVVALAEGLGYIPDSKVASNATVNISIDLGSAADQPSTVSVASGLKFESTVDNVTYTFQTRENLTAANDGTGVFRFKTLTLPTNNIQIYQGKQTTRTFVADAASQNATYVIQDANMDINTAVVRVYENSQTSQFTTFSNIKDATVINENTRLYILKEAPNGFFELSFGDGTTLGVAPSAGQKIEIDYLSVVGDLANGAKIFTPTSTITVNSVAYPISITTVSKSVGGAQAEAIDSIRKNAPFQYAAQNRMVTAVDYAALILRNFSEYITDIKSYGGEDALKQEFGTVQVSIVFNSDVTTDIQTEIKRQIVSLVDQLSVASFAINFVDPEETFVVTETFFQFNPSLTTLSQNTITSSVNTVVTSYFANNLGKFDDVFRRSNLLTLIDNVSPAVLSSRMNVKMERRPIPLLDKNQDINLRFPVPIVVPSATEYVITSKEFILQGKTCVIKNQLNSTKLQVIDTSTDTVLVDNIGSYVPLSGQVNIVGFKPNSVVGATSYLKVFAVPANPSAIAPARQDILKFDADQSFSTAVVVSTT